MSRDTRTSTTPVEQRLTMSPTKQPLTAANANPNAATAAAAVFKRHESNSSLSAAAAAAALAARPMTPTRVADVQTKRTMRRSGSAASSAASSDGHGRPGLHRRGSSGSMTERTFRSPSPHRPGSGGSAHLQQSQSLGHIAPEEMPPVPALPRNVGAEVAQTVTASQQGPSHRRATSLGVRSTPLRLASQSLGSEDAPSWFGASKVGDPRNVRRTDPAMASPPSSPPQVRGEELARSSSRASSINFSYPSRARVGSPPVSPVDTRHSLETQPKHAPPKQQQEPQQQQQQQQRQEHEETRPAQQTRHSKPQSKKRTVPSDASYTPAGPAPGPSDVLVYDPNSRRMVRQADLWPVEQTVRETSERQPGAKRKSKGSQRAGSHLAKGTVSRTGDPATTDYGRRDSHVDSAHSRPPAQPPTAPAFDSRELEEGSAVKSGITSPKIGAQRPEQNRGLEPSPLVQLPDSSKSGRVSKQTVKRQPSVVKEETEPESEPQSEPEKSAQRRISEALDAVPARMRVRYEGDQQPHPSTEHTPTTLPPLDIPVTSLPLATSQDTKSTSGTSHADRGSAHESLRLEVFEPPPSHDTRERASASSPVRQAHFGPVHNNLMVRHSPPPRSISPRKSALKNNGSPSRGASPSDDTSEASGGAAPREGPPVTRKKTVRVSFDDENTVVVGESAPANMSDSPVLASPQNSANRRPWYSSMGRTKKDLPPFDDDEIMKPRPALPSFGSVRDKIPRDSFQEEGERPLVRPTNERLPSSSTWRHSAAGVGAAPDPGLSGQSGGDAVDTVLTKEQEERSRILANTSRFREPLPPVVTSVEGGGYMSDTSSSSQSSSCFEPEEPAASEGTSVPVGLEPADSAMTSPEKPLAILTKTTETAPTPAPQETVVPTISVTQPTPPFEKKPGVSFFLDVPGGFPQDDSDTSAAEASKIATVPESAPREPVTSGSASGQPTLAPATEPPSDSESSIYSDAYEDLSEIEGDGFQSLDAVLESPVAPRPIADTVHREGTAQPSPAVREVEKPEFQVPTASTAAPQPQQAFVPEDEWEKAKVFWRSLSADKRAQLEREAAEEAGIEGDLEETKPVSKPKKKKSVERRNSERKALAVHLAQQMAAKQSQTRPETVDRNYMIAPGTKWAAVADNSNQTMRTTLRGQPAQESAATGNKTPRLRKSMRTDGSDAGSAGLAPPGQTRQADTRPASAVVTSSAPQKGSAHRRGASEQTSQAPLSLRRRGSTSSESSFKRARSGLPSGFRTSMRQAPPPASQPEKRSSKRFSLRSLSPGSAFKKSEGPPVSMTTGLHMRQTLRDSSSERKKSPSGLRIPSFGLSSSSKKAKKQGSGSRFSSRFGDSSDEDGHAGGSGFRSRFEDSSDDETALSVAQPKTLPPLLGQLQHQESLASTALPEELEGSDELLDNNTDASKPQQLPHGSVEPSSPTAPAPQEPSSATLRSVRPTLAGLPVSQTAPVIGSVAAVKAAERRNSTTSKRSSLMTALRRKKRDSSSKISRPEITESAARRDTKLERNLSQLRGIRSTEGEPDADVDVEAEAESGALEQGTVAQGKEIAPPRSPKLQKRVVSLSRAIENGNATPGPGTDLPSPLALPAATTPIPIIASEEKEPIRSPLRRPSARSGNLGTRTLSGSAVAGGTTGVRPTFLQRRTLSSGVMSVNSPSIAETAGTTGTGTTKKKKFGTLRRMFGLDG